MKFKINGIVSEIESSKPIQGLLVIAYDEDTFTKDDILGKAVTEKNGSFVIEFTEKDFHEPHFHHF